jgi:hypothetical protein
VAIGQRQVLEISEESDFALDAYLNGVRRSAFRNGFARRA